MKPPAKGRDLTQGPLGPAMFAVAWPVMLSSLFMTFYDLADAFWLGKLGKFALVAPTITMNVFFIALSLAMGLGTGGTTLVSQYRGAGRIAEMGRAGGQTLTLLLISGTAVAALGLVLAVPLLRALQTPADAFAGTLDYLRWTLVGLPFVFAFFVYQGISTGMGDTLGPLKVNAITMIANAVLDPFLIFGWGPFPELGVVGAAIATSLTRAMAGGLGLYLLLHGEHGFKLHRADLRWDSRLALRILRIGMPMSLGQTGTALGFTLLIGIVNSFGSAVTAAFGIGSRIIHMVMIPAFGLSSASATAVGQNLGADRPTRAAHAVRLSCAIITAVLLPLTTLMFFFGAEISRIFISDPDVVSYGRDLFQVTAYSVFVFGFIMVFMGAFQGSGYTIPVMILNMGRLWILRIPAAYLLAITAGLGPRGLWWAMFISNTVTAVAAAIWFARGTWKRKAMVEDARAGYPAAVGSGATTPVPPPGSAEASAPAAFDG